MARTEQLQINLNLLPAKRVVIRGWIEQYRVRRGKRLHWYHRYCWSEGRGKVHRRHIRLGKLGLVLTAMGVGCKPQDIRRLLKR